MNLSKISQRRQITIPKDIFEDMNFHEGDYVEIIRANDDELILKRKKIIDIAKQKTQLVFPQVPSYEERMRLLKLLEANATDDSQDIDLDFIRASHTSKDSTISFDE